MKKQNYLPNRKQLILFLMIMSFMAASLAQKSIITRKEDSNISYLKSLAAVIGTLQNDHSGYFVKPAELENVKFNNNSLKFEEYVFITENSYSEEEKIKVEDWMMNEEHFRIKGSNELYEIAEEETIAIEEWMLNEDHFKLPASDDELDDTAEEEKLVIEDWMLDESHFLSGTDRIENENTVEDELKVENWMLDPDHWVLRAD